MFDNLYIGGSRSWLDYSVILSAIRSINPQRVIVGCAAGADAEVIRVCQSLSIPFHLFCVGNAGGAGFWSGSNPAISSVAGHAAVVSWFGDLSVPLSARLAIRSRCAVSAAQASLFFLAQPGSKGSINTAAYAASQGQPVFAISPAGVPVPLPGQAGVWQPRRLAGVPVWHWQISQLSF